MLPPPRPVFATFAALFPSLLAHTTHATPATATSSRVRGDVVVLRLSDKAVAPGQNAWLSSRLADMVTEKLSLLGVSTRDRRFLNASDPRKALAANGVEAVVSGRARP